MKKNLLLMGFIALSPNLISQTVTYDGNIDVATEGWKLQSTNAGGPAPGFGAGHEINALYVSSTTSTINLAVAGNVQNNNRIVLFLDTKPGGYSNGDFGRTSSSSDPVPQGVDEFNSGTTFDVGFLPDYALVIGTNSTHDNFYFDLFRLEGTAAGGGGFNDFLGDMTVPNIGANPANSDNTRGFEISIEKSKLQYDDSFGNIKIMAMYISDGGYLSNQFLTPASSGQNDFGGGAVNFSNEPPGPIEVDLSDVTLPVKFTAASGKIENGQAVISWEIAEESNVAYYAVEKMNSDGNFVEAARVNANNSSRYAAIDATVLETVNHYRIKAVDIDGSYTYSTGFIVSFEADRGVSISLFPNPAKGNTNLSLTGLVKGNYSLQLVNLAGQVVWKSALAHDGTDRYIPLVLANKPTGVYQLVLKGAEKVYSHRLVIE